MSATAGSTCEGCFGTVTATYVPAEVLPQQEPTNRTALSRQESPASGTTLSAGDKLCSGPIAAPDSGALVLNRALHLPNSYWAVVDGDLYTATLDESRRDEQDRALYVVKESGREFTTVRTVPQARDAILARINDAECDA